MGQTRYWFSNPRYCNGNSFCSAIQVVTPRSKPACYFNKAQALTGIVNNLIRKNHKGKVVFLCKIKAGHFWLAFLSTEHHTDSPSELGRTDTAPERLPEPHLGRRTSKYQAPWPLTDRREKVNPNDSQRVCNNGCTPCPWGAIHTCYCRPP